MGTGKIHRGGRGGRGEKDRVKRAKATHKGKGKRTTEEKKRKFQEES
jgi:hypothetical protein